MNFGKLGSFWAQIVSLSITISIVGLGIGFFYLAKPMHDVVSERMDIYGRLSYEAQFSAYNSHTVAGSSVITAMRRYSLNDDFFVYVLRPSSTNYIADPSRMGNGCFNINWTSKELLTTRAPAASCNIQLDQMLDETSPYYVRYLDSYYATIVRDRNQRVAGLLFELK